MSFWPFSKRSPKPDAPDAAPASSDRIQTAVLTCSLGTIVEVWRGGVVIRASSPVLPADPASTIELDLCAPTDEIAVKARLVRSTPQPRGCLLELAFVGLTSADEDAVQNLARFGRRRPAGTSDPAFREKLVQPVKLPDYYAVLGVPLSASPEQIQAAFRALARTFHPDVNTSPDAQERFCAISAANEVLSDPARRAEYDRTALIRSAA